MRRAALTLLLATLAIGPAGAARADSDPASDILLAQDAFYPYQPPTSPALSRALEATLAEAHRTGLALKVAVIDAQTDLGGVPNLWGMPARYAQFLDSEISFNRPQPLLVVMPAGLGVAGLGSVRAPAVGVDGAHGADGLVRTAALAVQRLAAATGHPIPAVSLPAPGSHGGGGTPTAVIFGVPVAVILIVGGLLALRGPRSREEAYGPEADEEP